MLFGMVILASCWSYINVIERYCIPMDDCRPITHAEIQFFSTYGTGKGDYMP